MNEWMIAYCKLKGLPEEIVLAYSKAHYVENRSKEQVLKQNYS